MFLAVAEEQHFARAAKRLGMSQPPLTMQIQILERSLGLKLFDRSRRGTVLSAAGAAILPAVRRFAAQAEQLEAVIREVVAGQSAVLHIGAINSAMLDTVPPLLEALRSSHPQLSVFVKEIDSADAVPGLEAGAFDLAFARLEGEVADGIATMPLAEDRLAVAMPTQHALAGLPRIRLKSLDGEHLVMSSRQVSPVYFDMLVSVCRANGFSPRIFHEVRSLTSQLAYVSCGQGLALVPASMRKLAPPNVAIRPLKERVTVVTAAAVWSERRYHPIVEAAVAWLQVAHRKVHT
ncbi:LysR substrate-binding domain-containing protein [Bosea sp. F3-2]|uniref:LysR substrate-binding domain-containing protein n=1 Tax=Bosea sp. F3-2 TaxID=2599640 RepID=UPI0020C17D86|nr:LysR substrate-binding domain-containing protein [Bosea sp. F3-2]